MFFATYLLLQRTARRWTPGAWCCQALPRATISTRPLRTYLKVLGYAAHGWKRRPNHGPRPGVEAGMDARLADLWRLYQRKVTLIGWSLRGVFAREMARRAPDLVRQVVTLASDAWRLAEIPRKRRSMTGRVVKSRSCCRRPSTAIHSCTDVDWKRRSRTSANSQRKRRCATTRGRSCKNACGRISSICRNLCGRSSASRPKGKIVPMRGRS